MCIAELYTKLSTTTLPSGWIIHKFNEDKIHCIQLKQQHIGTPVMLFHLLTIEKDLTWKLHTANHLVSLESPALCQQPLHLMPDSAQRVIELIDSSNFCIGNSEKKFIELARKRKGKFLSTSGEPVACFEEGVCLKTASGEERCETIRHKDCLLLLLTSEMCSVCEKYCNTLRAMFCRQKKKIVLQSPHPKMNKRFFRTPQRRRHFRSLQKSLRNQNRQLKRLKSRLEKVVEDDSIEVDDALSQDLKLVMDDPDNNEYVKGQFKRIFWEQQV